MADNNIQQTQDANAAYFQANPNIFGTPTTTTSPTTITLANGQPAGSSQTGTTLPETGGAAPGGYLPVVPPPPAPTGLQMPVNGADLSYNPATGTQQTPAEKAFAQVQASGTPPPQSSGEVGTQVKDAINQQTPPKPVPPPSTPNVDNAIQNNPTLQQETADLMNFFNPPEQQKQLNDQLAKIAGENTDLAGVKTEEMNLENVMSGNEDMIRNEVTKANGFATEGQILAMTASRNKSLLLNQKVLLQKISNIQQAIANDTTLFQNEKDMANTQFTQKSGIYQMLQTNRTNIENANRTNYDNIIKSVGYAGLAQTVATDPYHTALIEQTLGLQPGGLQQLVNVQKDQTNLVAIKAAGITTPYVLTRSGEVQNTQTGQGYTSEADFQQKTGMTLQQAQASGKISTMQNATSQAQVTNLMDKYPDAGIQPTDTLAAATVKLQNSKLYRKDTYIAPVGGASGGIKVSYQTINGQVTQLITTATGEVISSTSMGMAGVTTDTQRASDIYATRTSQADQLINSSSDAIVKMNPLLYETQSRLPSYLQSGTLQSYDQASRNFINAVLRRESGAVISPSEFTNAYQQYLPRPGDTTQTLQQKAQNRQAIVTGLQNAAGSASTQNTTAPKSTNPNDPLGLGF